MVGVPGSGKSFFAEHFSDTFKAPIVSWNILRDDLFNDPTYSKEEDEVVERVADRLLGELYKTEKTLLFEGDTSSRAARQRIQKAAHAAGYETLFVWVQTDEATAKRRAKKAGVPAEYSEKIQKRFTPPKENEPVLVISGKHTYASQLKIVLRRLSGPRDAAVPTPEARPKSGRQITIR